MIKHNRIANYYESEKLEYPQVKDLPISVYNVKGSFHICQNVGGKIQAIQIEDEAHLKEFIKRLGELLT
jgi:hypothetical protein